MRDIVSTYLKTIKETDQDIKAFLEIYDDVEEQAEGQGKDKPLSGVLVALKDNLLLKGKKAQSASQILSGYKAPYTATAVERLKQAGAIFVGRTNMDEFAMGSSTEHSSFGPTRNPHDPSRIPGGSSGGSAAAVAAGMVTVALGSDTGGSIRQPAALCGVVGLKPTYGAVSRYGLMAMGSSLDQIGPFGRSVTDVEKIHNIIAGPDEYDATTLTKEERADQPKTKDSYTIGVPWSLVEREGIDEGVLENFRKSLEKLREQGHEIKDVEFEYLEKSLAVYYIVMPAEVSSNLARFDGVKYGLRAEAKDGIEEYFATRAAGFGDEVKRRIILGTYLLSAGYYDAYYGQAVQVRSLIRQELEEKWQDVDLIATPTTPTPAWELGEISDPLQMYLADIFTVPANIAGVPAISVPSGEVETDGAKLPLGLQFMAPHLGEDRLFDVGKRFLDEN